LSFSFLSLSNIFSQQQQQEEEEEEEEEHKEEEQQQQQQQRPSSSFYLQARLPRNIIQLLSLFVFFFPLSL